MLNVEGTSPGQLLCVYDIQGKVMQSILVNSVSCQLDISNLNTGIYLLKAGYEIIKFVKK
ncbi:MAG: T9SS type A sorting domain-containing protein [Prevotella pleuritidis]|nr:T9SS type A sorting domain-containing protein [Hoylesella pleuritidis]